MCDKIRHSQDYTYLKPSLIENAIIDFNSNTFNNIPIDKYKNVVSDLSKVGCRAVFLRFFDDEYTSTKVQEILSIFNDSRISHISLLVKDNNSTNEKLIDFFLHYLRVCEVLIHCSDEDSEVKYERESLIITKTKRMIDKNLHCGEIHPSLFTVNIDLFIESQYFNNCLNKKVSIDEFGNIKNCPSISKSFGNILVDSIPQVVKNKNFQLLWHIDKSKVIDCQICEFRYICQDCRANVNNVIDKPSKCKYNPYEGKWSN